MPVTKDDLLTEATAGLVAQLKNGQRAMAIRVTPESLVGGFVLPGSKVDIVWTKKRGDAESTTQIIQQDMLILAVDQKETRDEGQRSILGNTATLAATAEQAEQLTLASSMGELRLLLRSPLDTETPKYKPLTLDDMTRDLKAESAKNDSTDVASTGGISVVLPALPKIDKTPTPPVAVVDKTPAPPPSPVTHTLRIESGDSVTKAVFVWDEKNACWEGGPAAKKAAAPKPEDAPKAPADKDAPVG